MDSASGGGGGGGGGVDGGAEVVVVVAVVTSTEDEADEDEEDDDAVVNKSRWCRCDKPPIPEHLYGEDEEEPPTRAHGAPAPLPAEYV